MYILTQIMTIPIVVTIIAIIYLCIYDIKFKQIPIWIIFLLSGFGIINQILMSDTLTKTLIETGGCILGTVILLLLGRVTKEQIGYGDGFVFLMMSLLNSWQMALTIYLVSFILAGIYGLVLILINRKRRGQNIAFMPFITVTYLILVFVR